MEHDDETHSHESEGSRSPVDSPRSNGRITVTVAAVPPHHQNTLTLALPIQQQQQQQQYQQNQSRSITTFTGGSGGSGGGGGGGGGGREDCWSEGATGVLIDAWGERYMELSRGNLKQKHWKEVADIVSSREDYRKVPKTDIQCKNRIDTVKKKYKLEKAKIGSGQGPSRWPFFEKLDHLIGSTAKINSVGGGGVGVPGVGSSNLFTQKVPMGIPMGVRSLPQLRQHQQQQKQKQKQPLRRRRRMDSDTSESESEPDLSPDSADSLPPQTYKRPRVQGMHSGGIGEGSGKGGSSGSGKGNNWGSSLRELTKAILRFGEAYEQAESAKVQQMVEMETRRMEFTREMELQRLQFFMNTQLELSQLKPNRRVGNSNHLSNINHRSNNNASAANHNNNSDNSI